MYSTGPLFLSVIWKEYMATTRTAEARVRVLMPDEYKGHSWSFFNVVRGSSWHGKDAQTIFWMGKHWMLLTITGFVVAGVVGSALWWVWTMWVMKSGRPLRKYGLRKRVSAKEYELVDRMA